MARNMTTADAVAHAARLPPGPQRDAMLAQLNLRPASSLPAAAPATVGGAQSLPRPVGNQPNKLEAEFARRLDVLVRTGEIRWYAFNAIRLRLADPVAGGRTMWHKIDFSVTLPSGVLVMLETKGGHITEGGMLRWRWAAEQYPHLRIQMWQRKRGQGWACVRDSRPHDPGPLPIAPAGKTIV